MKRQVVLFVALLSLAAPLLGQTVTPEWVVPYSGPMGEAVPQKQTIDQFGNVYVTGGSKQDSDDYDFVTIKYSPDGHQLWLAVYDGVLGGHDWPTAICVDDEGNVYVTGASHGSHSGTDFITIKYSSGGVQEWVTRYDGKNHLNDWPRAVTVDDGNVYVTGGSASSGTFWDITTIKYDADGAEQWVARYDGLMHQLDFAHAMVVDPSGNVYVAGESQGENGTDFVTIKYAASGAEQWVASYDSRLTDQPSDLAVDVNSVYVCGRSQQAVGLGDDIITIKYASLDGIEQWVARYDGPANAYDIAHAISVDGKGNVYVAGESQGISTGSDYITIKYASLDGIEQWVARYDGRNLADYATKVTTDRLGNVYVAGESRILSRDPDLVTIMYDGLGHQQWLARFSSGGSEWPVGLDVCREGNIYVTGRSVRQDISSYVTIKYSTPVNSSLVQEAGVPVDYRLQQNYPNPLNPETTIEFALPKDTQLSIKISNMLGQEIRTLIDQEVYHAGVHRIMWDGRDDTGNVVPSGMYFYRLESGSFTAMKKMMLMK